MKKESTEAEAAAIESFNSVEAMNTAGFPEFLAKFPDAEAFDVNDKKAMETRFGAFKSKAEAAREMSGFFKEELRGQNLGIDFENAELQGLIGGRIESMAFENPEKVNEIFETLSKFEELTKQVSSAEKTIAALSGEGDLDAVLEEFKKKKEILESAAETERFFTGAGFVSPLLAAYEKFAFGFTVDYAKEWLATHEGSPTVTTRKEMEEFIKDRTTARRRNDARVTLKKEYMIEPDGAAIEKALEETNKKIEELSRQSAALAELEQARDMASDQVRDIRDMILAGVGTNEQLKELAKKKAHDKLTKLMNSNPDEAQKFFEDLDRVSTDNSLNIDYLGDKRDKFQEDIETHITTKVAADMRKAIETTSFGPKAYDKLVRSLESFLKRQKVGTKEGDDAHAFVIDTLKSIAQEVGAKDKAKGILIRFMLSRLG